MPTGTVPQRWTEENLTKAFKAINDKIGANPADYVELTINSLKVMVKAINPRKRENVDEYDYDGTNVETLPVNVSGGGPGGIEESAFESDTVKPAALAEVLGRALNDSGVENGAISSVLVDNTFADGSDPTIQVNVSGPRASKSARYDLTGQLQQVV